MFKLVEDYLYHLEYFNYNICVVNESCLKPKDRKILAELKDGDYDFISVPCPKDTIGGGISISFKRSYKVTLKESKNTLSFESAVFSVTASDNVFHIATVYRWPYSEVHPVTVSVFLNDFPTFLEELFIYYNQPIFIGDFNILDENNTVQFLQLRSNFALDLYTDFPTHQSGNTLDPIMCKTTSMLNVSNASSDYFIMDYTFISCDVALS